jgi:PEP-CTERM motif-containing protein
MNVPMQSLQFKYLLYFQRAALAVGLPRKTSPAFSPRSILDQRRRLMNRYSVLWGAVVLVALLTVGGAAKADEFMTACPDKINTPPTDGITNSPWTECAYVIVFNANGSITIDVNQRIQAALRADSSDPEDVLVGVINNSGQTQTSVRLVGTPDDPNVSTGEIFDFDKWTDGVYHSDFGLPGLTGYEGPGVHFSDVVCDAGTFFTADASGCGVGTVNFNLAPGKHTYFGLEGKAALDDTTDAPPFTTVSTVPEPASLILIATGIGGYFRLRRRK